VDAALKSKIEHHFGRMAVDKRQALQAGFELMPRFVTEYLLAAARDRNGALECMTCGTASGASPSTRTGVVSLSRA